MKINNDSKEQIKSIGLFFLQFYKILMGTMLTLFVPQKCYYDYDSSCNSDNNFIINSTSQCLLDSQCLNDSNLFSNSQHSIIKKEKLCSLNDNLTNLDIFTFGFNCCTGFCFILLYIVELKREYWLIKTFDINHSLPDDNLKHILVNMIMKLVRKK